nr:hypothetical protein BCU62_21730 [Enterovibrio norvegicus]
MNTVNQPEGNKRLKLNSWSEAFKMKDLNPQYQVKQLLRTLQKFNCQVTRTVQTEKTLVVHVDAPVPELQHRSVEITETVNGLTRRIRAARHSGCCVVWED